jgi:hypothetical protein
MNVVMAHSIAIRQLIENSQCRILDVCIQPFACFDLSPDPLALRWQIVRRALMDTRVHGSELTCCADYLPGLFADSIAYSLSDFQVSEHEARAAIDFADFVDARGLYVGMREHRGNFRFLRCQLGKVREE